MSVGVCALITWIVLIIFTVMPKKLSELDMIFLYFVNTIFELSVFTIVHINLKWLTVSHGVEESFADLILRLIMIPVVFVIATNILLYSWKFLKWMILIGIIIFFIMLSFLLEKLGVIILNHWNIFYTIIMFSSYAVFSRLMAWFIVNAGRKEVKKI